MYEVDKKEVKIDAAKAHELAFCSGKIEELGDDEKKIIEEAKGKLEEKMNNIKDKIRADIEKVKVRDTPNRIRCVLRCLANLQ